MRLIDADALIANIGIADDCLICKKASLLGCKGTERDFVHACECITDAPTIDAVEVVRCKDCRWGKEVCGNIECFADSNVPTEYHGYEWFCPNGERREA